MAIDDRSARALAIPTPASFRYVFPDSSDELIYGTAQADTLTGNYNHQWLFGLGGNDRLFGGGGDDYLDGGGYNDSFDGGDGSDTLLYTLNTTSVRVDFEAGLVDFPGQRWAAESFVAVENVHTGSGNDIVLGDGGSNLIFTHAGNDLLRGGVGDDGLEGGGDSDRLYGDAGNDTLLGGAGRDSLWGGDGDDTLDGGGSNDRMDGGRGSDTVLYAVNTTAVSINLGTGRASFPGQTWTPEALVAIENVTTGSGNDRVIGSRAANVLTTGAGDDYIAAGRGNDRIIAGDGDDRLLGGIGTDRLEGAEGNDRLYGGGGADVLVGGEGTDYLHGGAGIDTAVYLAAKGDGNVSDEVVVDLARGRADFPQSEEPAERLVSIENVSTGNGDDTIFGSNRANFISGGSGSNAIFGGDGDDVIHGGNSSLESAVWEDRLPEDSDVGRNTFGDYLVGGDGDDIIYTHGSLVPSYRPNAFFEAGYEMVFGGRGDDTIVADYGDLEIAGGSGADTFIFSDEIESEGDNDFSREMGEFATIADYDRSAGERITIDVEDVSIARFAGDQADEVGEYGFYIEDGVTHAHYIIGVTQDYTREGEVDRLLAVDVTLTNLSDGLRESDFLFV